jgi:hypothetical protein
MFNYEGIALFKRGDFRIADIIPDAAMPMICVRSRVGAPFAATSRS